MAIGVLTGQMGRPGSSYGHIEWDNNVLPYLGFWITAGGFRGDYNCAWEPSSGYYDSVSRALRNNAVWELLPQEEKQFDITITVHENSQRK